MHRRPLLHFLLAGLVVPWATAARAAQRLTGARAWQSDDKLRLVLELSGPSHYRTFSLQSPQRLIIDLDDTRLATRLDTLPANSALLKAVRSGVQGNGTRIVLELDQAAALESFLLPPQGDAGYRLVLDLRSAAAPAQVAQAAAHAPEPAPEPAPRQASARQPAGKQRDIVVVIDAGHGGKDPGAVGANGEQEKVVALAIARQLAQKLNRQPGFRAQLVRNDDVFIPLRKRVEVARRHNADMFISVHADAAPRRTASGASVFALSENGATSTTARWLAEKENNVDLIGARQLLSLKDKDPMLAGVILDMSLNSTIATSLQLGKTILDSVGAVAGTHQRRVEQAGFAVLKSPDIPSILVETGFISNAGDCRQLCDPRHQDRVAQAIFAGIHGHFQANPPSGTLLAERARQPA